MTKMSNMRVTIHDKLQSLVGAELRHAGRAVGLMWFLFVQQHNGLGQERATREEEVRLHVQCAWRITHAQTILVASSDRFYPQGDPHQEDETFDWTVPLSNRCDERMATLFSDRSHTDWRVSAVRADQFGGCEVRFGKRRRLSVFPDDSLGEEYGRIFGTDVRQAHFVVTGQGVVLE